ncbi:MAG: hypothetical protein LBP56_00670 [Odoribacteraceae bacterium]|jgi:hypothetical protein|nr:hypothetical protein [Odoribacteraceae bacterium]
MERKVEKTMKNGLLAQCRNGLGLSLIFVCTGIFFISCGDWLDNDSTPYYSRYAVVNKQDAKVSFLTDGGLTLYTDSKSAAVTGLENNQRVIVDFIVREELEDTEYKIGLYSIYKVLTKDALVLREAISDSLGRDPVEVNRVWIRHGYLNVDFTFWGGEPGLKHMVNLAVDTSATSRDADCLVEFRHNAFKDPYVRHCRGVVAFPLKSILDHVKLPEERPDEITLKLKIKYYGLEGSEHFLPLDWKIASGRTVTLESEEVGPGGDDENYADTEIIQ